jgi:O-antigen ligase
LTSRYIVNVQDILEKGQYLLFFLIAVRPLIDFSPPLEMVDNINVGGIWGGGIAFIIYVMFTIHILRKKALNFLYIIMLFSLLIIGCFYIINLIILNSADTIIDLSRFIVGFTPFLLIPLAGELYEQNQSKKLFRWFYFSFTIALTPSVIITFLQFFNIWEGFYGLYAGLERATGGYTHPGHFGRFMIFFTFFSYIAVLKSLLSRKIIYPLVLLIWVATFLSGHRTSLVIVSLIILFGELFRLKDFILKGYRVKKIMIVTICLCVLLVIFLSSVLFIFEIDKIQHTLQQTINSFKDIPNQILVDNKVFADKFMNKRGRIWQRTIDFMDKQPFYSKLIGYGETVYDSHNEFLHRYLNSGILGIVLLYGIFFPALFIYVLKFRNKTSIYLCKILFMCYFLFSIPLQPSNYPNFMWLFFIGIFFILLLNVKIHKTNS